MDRHGFPFKSHFTRNNLSEDKNEYLRSTSSCEITRLYYTLVKTISGNRSVLSLLSNTPIYEEDAKYCKYSDTKNVYYNFILFLQKNTNYP